MECSLCCGSNAVCLTKSFTPLAKQNQYNPSCAPFGGISSYRSAFTGCYVPPSRSMKPDTSRSYDASCAPFDGISTYRAAFLPFSVCPPVPQPLSKKVEYSFSCAPFDGISTYRGDFRGCVVPRVPSLKPLHETFYDPSCAPMDGMTTHRCSFIPYCLRDCMYTKQRSAKPTTGETSGEVSCAPFDGMTSYRCDFFPHCPNKRQAIMKPDSNRPSFSDAPFADLSTYRTDFAPFHFINCDGDILRGNCSDPSYCHDPCPPSNDCETYSANIGTVSECCGGSYNIQCAGEGDGVCG